MLLVDFSNLCFSQILQDHAQTKQQPDMKMLRILVLGAMSRHKGRLKEFGDMTICFDGKKYWRRKVFAHYKGSRASEREKSTFDWEAFFPMLDQFKLEIREHMPVRCLEVEGAEADDVIATLAKTYGPHEPVCILSSDKDFIQIQQTVCPKVKQWSLYHGKYLTPKNTEYNLVEHIIRGDTGDGVPNMLSDGDTLVNPDKKQKPVFKKLVEEGIQWGMGSPEKFCKTFEILENFKRNRQMIDLREIPEELAQEIINQYNNTPVNKGDVFNYYVANRLAKLLENGRF
jgi:hypothetical protein